MYMQSYLPIWSDMTPAKIVFKYWLSVRQPIVCQPGFHPHSCQLSLLNRFQKGQDSSLANTANERPQTTVLTLSQICNHFKRQQTTQTTKHS